MAWWIRDPLMRKGWLSIVHTFNERGDVKLYVNGKEWKSE